MPWTVKDVSKHKKGLSTEQKKKWVSIANSVLRECQSNNEGNCEQKAIRTANSRINNNTSVASLNKSKNFVNMETKEHTLIVQSVDTASYPIRMETYEDKQYMVVPVVMMVEGVHNGSRGPLFHSAQSLERSADLWNGVPVTVNHPQNNEGQYISAHAQGQESTHVGKMFNVHMEGSKLKGEAWIDVQKIAAVSPEALSCIEDQHPLDVSIGSFTTEEEKEGEWNGEQYRAIALNHRPDHLALLPNEQGACNWQDGCGVRVNSLNQNNMPNEQKTQFQVYKDLNKNGLALVPVVNETGFAETLTKVSTYLDSMDSDMKMHFLEELYDDRVIYRVRNRESGSSTLYQQNYSMGDDGKVEFNGDPKEVRKEVSYQAMSSGKFRRTKFNNNKSNGMSTEEVSKKVDALIANTNSKFTNCDRDWLESLTVDKLNELMPKEEPKEKPKQEPMDVNKAIEFLKKNPPEQKQVLELLSAESKEAYEQGLQLYKDKKDKMVKTITANSSAWTEEELKGMDFSLLEKISKSVKPEADYSGQGAGGDLGVNKDEDDEFLPVNTVDESK